MKAAFDIQPDKEEIRNLHLLFEAGDHGISCCWFTKNPFDVKGIGVYNFPLLADDTEKARELELILQAEPVFATNTLSTSICYNFRESMPVPAEYYKPGSEKEMLSFLFDSGAECKLRCDEVAGKGINIMYSVNRKIDSVITRRFPDAAIFHASSRQLTIETPAGDELHCIVFHNMIKVILFKSGMLQLLQYFNYAGTTDVAYHLLNCCNWYDLSPDLVKLRICGLIDTGSLLYNELYKYFSQINFIESGSEIKLHDRIKNYPAHYFSHLTSLLPCES